MRTRFRSTTILGSLLAIMIIASLGVMGLVLEHFVRSELERQTGEGNRLIAVSVAHEINSFLSIHFNALSLLDKKSFRDVDGTDLLNKAYPAFEHVLITNSAGRVVQESSSSGELGFDLSAREYFRVPFSTRENFVSPPFISGPLYIPNSVLARPFPGGVSIAYISLSFMNEFLKSLPSSANKSISVVDKRGVFVAHNADYSLLGRSEIVSLESWFRDHDGREGNGLSIVTRLDGVEELLCWATVPGISGWTVIVSEPTERVFRAVYILRVAVLVFFAVYALFALLLNMTVLRFVRRDIEMLVRFSQKITDGELDSRIDFQGFYDFTHLAANLEHMGEAIQERELQLKANERRLFDLLDFLPIPVILLTREKNIELMNRAMERTLGWTQDEIITEEDWFLSVYPDEQIRENTKKFWDSYINELMQGKQPESNFRGILCCRDGSFRTLVGEAAMIADRIVVTFVDVTQADEAAAQMAASIKEKELLLSEVHHRIKNNMNTIKGLLTLQIAAETNHSAAEALRDAEGRVQGIIMLYDRLYLTDNCRELSVREYFEPLMDEVVNSFPNRDIVVVHTDIQDLILNIQFLTPLGILVNELLTNMMKHAFTGRHAGRVSLSVSQKENHITVILEDDGIGLPESVSLVDSTGFGMMLTGMLIEQMGGTIHIDRDSGTKFTIEFNM